MVFAVMIDNDDGASADHTPNSFSKSEDPLEKIGKFTIEIVEKEDLWVQIC